MLREGQGCLSISKQVLNFFAADFILLLPLLLYMLRLLLLLAVTALEVTAMSACGCAWCELVSLTGG